MCIQLRVYHQYAYVCLKNSFNFWIDYMKDNATYLASNKIAGTWIAALSLPGSGC